MHYVIVWSIQGYMHLGPHFGGPFPHIRALEVQADAAQFLGAKMGARDHLWLVVAPMHSGQIV